MEAKPAIERKISAVTPGEHICCIVSDARQYREVLVQSLADGLQAGQQVIFAYHRHDPETILRWLDEAGVITTPALAENRLILRPARDMFDLPEASDGAALVKSLRTQVELAGAAGFASLRFASDMGWAGGGQIDDARTRCLLSYEAQINFPGALNACTLLCLYERSAFDPAVLVEVLSNHPVLIDGLYAYQNACYMPGAVYLSPRRDEARLEQHLRAITSHQRLEWQYERVSTDIETQAGGQSDSLARVSQQLSCEVQHRQGAETALAGANAALLETENRYRTIFNAATEAIFIQGLDGLLLEVNRIACQRLGYTEQDLAGKSADFLDVPELAGQASVRTTLVSQYGAISYETVHQTRAGDMIPVEVNARLIEYDGRPAVLSIARDITDRKHAELALVNANEALATANEALAESYGALRESEQKFRSLTESSPDGIALVDESGRIIEFNAANEILLGKPASTVLGKKLASLAVQVLAAPGNRANLRRAINAAIGEALHTGESQWLCKVHEKEVLHPDGKPRSLQITAFPVQTERGYMIGLITRDMTAHRMAEVELEQYRQRLEFMVAERTAQLQHEITERQQVEQNLEVMLREIHHRVKNNLNVIISLIDLQKGGLTDPQVLQVFKELQARAYTMALVHESLYRSPNLAQVNFSGYLKTLVDYLQSVYGLVACCMPITYRVEAENVDLKIETAIPCGLIVNELVTNALKYAFQNFIIDPSAGRACPEVSVRLERTWDSNDSLMLTVSDNGTGLPAGINWQTASTLGLQLVQVLARQIGGSITLDSSHGAVWRLTFAERR